MSSNAEELSSFLSTIQSESSDNLDSSISVDTLVADAYVVPYSILADFLAGLDSNTADKPYRIKVVEYTETTCAALNDVLISAEKYVDLSETVLEGLTDVSGGTGYGFFDNTYLTGAPVLQGTFTDMNFTFKNCTSLTKIASIASNVTAMTDTYYGCTALKEVSVTADAVTEMKQTFWGCTSLVSVTSVPDTVTGMQYTFSKCKALTTVSKLSSAAADITGIFQGCTSLVSSPEIPSSVTDMTRAFNGCSSLTSAPVLPSGVTSISYAFNRCSSLAETPVLPDSLTDIRYAFTACTSLLKSAVIPSNVTAFTGAFSNCTSMTEASDVNSDDVEYSAFSGSLKIVKIGSIPSATIKDYFPECYENITTITNFNTSYINTTDAPAAFFADSGVKYIDFSESNPDDVSYICAGMNFLVSNINLGSKATKANYTFANCTAYTDDVIPSIPSTVTSMAGLFYGCTGFTQTMTIPVQVTSIDHMYEGCVNLVTVNDITATNVTFEDCFKGDEKITSVRKIKYGTITDLSALITDSKIIKILDLDSEMTVPYTTFFGTQRESIQSISGLPSSRTSMAGDFKNCTALTSINSDFPEDVTDFSNTFENCTSITSVVLPDSIEILKEAFKGCSTLKSVTNFDEGITTVESAFDGCISLTELIDWDIDSGSVTMDGAFNGCVSLTTIRIKGSNEFDFTEWKLVYLENSDTGVNYHIWNQTDKTETCGSICSCNDLSLYGRTTGLAFSSNSLLSSYDTMACCGVSYPLGNDDADPNVKNFIIKAACECSNSMIIMDSICGTQVKGCCITAEDSFISNGTLTISGASTFNGYVRNNANTYLCGTLDVANTTCLKNGLYVSGGITCLCNNLSVSGVSTFCNNICLTGTDPVLFMNAGNCGHSATLRVNGVNGYSLDILKVYSSTSYGHNIALESGGLTVIGSGESASMLIDSLGCTYAGEILYNTSDNDVCVISNLQNGTNCGYAWKYDTNGCFIGPVKNSRYFNLGSELDFYSTSSNTASADWAGGMRLYDVNNCLALGMGMYKTKGYYFGQYNCCNTFISKEGCIWTSGFVCACNGRFTSGNDLTTTSYDTDPLVVGAKTSNNIGFDDNEIQARNNGTAAALFLNNEGGNVYFGRQASYINDTGCFTGKAAGLYSEIADDKLPLRLRSAQATNDTSVTTGFHYYAATALGSNSPFYRYHTANCDLMIIQQNYSDNWGGQIAMDFRTSNIAYRSCCNQTYTNWKHFIGYVPSVSQDVNDGGYWMGMTTGTGKDTSWYHVISMGWDNTCQDLWKSQFLIPTQGSTTKHTSFRYNTSNCAANCWSSWYDLIDTQGGQTISGTLNAQCFDASQAFSLTSGKVYGLTTGHSRLYGNGFVMSNPATANDQGWIRTLGTSESDTVLEIATGDDGGTGELIKARQYNTSSAIVHEMTILDASGNTIVNNLCGTVLCGKTSVCSPILCATSSIAVGSTSSSSTVITLTGKTVNTNTYADANPKIRFLNESSAQGVSLTYTDYDTVQAPASITLNGQQGGEYFIAPNVKATSNVYVTSSMHMCYNTTYCSLDFVF